MSDFNVITPIAITDAILTGSNVPENDYPEWVIVTTYATGTLVMCTIPNVHNVYQSKTDNNVGNYPPNDTTNWLLVGPTLRWKAFDGTIGSQVTNIFPDILDEDCADISDWISLDSGTGVSEVSPAGQFRFDTNGTADTSAMAGRSRIIDAPPDLFTLEFEVIFDALGTRSNVDMAQLIYSSSSWRLWLEFGSDGLFVIQAGSSAHEIGTNIVKCNGTAALQKFRFQVNKTVEASATMDVYLDDVYQETISCNYAASGIAGELKFRQWGQTTINIVSHVESLRISSGCGPLFDAETISYVLTPGSSIDSVALFNLDSDTVEIVEIDTADDLVTNGTEWAGATGTTQPTSWDKVGTPTDFTNDDGMLRLTVDGNEGISQTINVLAETEYQLIGLYKNTSGDTAQYAVYDMSNSANIKATTDLTSSTTISSFSCVFTTPAACISIKISLLAKINGDIVWFDLIRLAPTEYSETVTTGASKKSVIKTDIPQKATGILTVTINKSSSAAIGELKIGTKTTLGTMRPKPQIGFRNLSTLDEDTFGNIDIVARGYKQKLICGITVTNTSLDAVYEFLCDHKDDMMVYVGSEAYSCLQLYGFSKEPSIVVGEKLSDMSLEIWSVI